MSTPKTSINPQYSIKKCVFSSEFLPDLDLELRESVVEVNFYETLDKPYITGEITILDNMNIFSMLNFQGTERVNIVIETGDLDDGTLHKIDKSFIAYKIKNQVKGQDGKKSMFLIKIIEEHGFLGNINKISKSYHGKFEDIIKKICINELNQEGLNVTYTGSGGLFYDTVQEEVRCIVPNISVNNALTWLTDRITTKNGSPYFIYSTLLSNTGNYSVSPERDEKIKNINIRLGNLDYMLLKEPFNIRPYIYNPNAKGNLSMEREIDKAFIVQNIEFGSSADTHGLMQVGSISSTYSNTDIGTGQRTNNKKYTLDNQLKKLNLENHINYGYQNVYNPFFKINEKSLSEYNGVNVHTITSQGTYGNFNSYHDEKDENKFINKISSNAIKNVLHKNKIKIMCEAFLFLRGEVKVGDSMRLLIVSDFPSADQKDIDETGEFVAFDQRHSGTHLIYSIKYTFSNNKSSIVATLCKLERNIQEQDETNV